MNIYKYILISITLFISCVHKPNKALKSRYIAHALGGYNETTYLNCKEAFEQNYSKGYRLFEMDFLMSSDGIVVGMHDGQEKAFGLHTNFSHEQFKASSLSGTTPLDINDVVNLMVQNTDWYLITDVKTDNLRALKQIVEVCTLNKINGYERVIPQIYNPTEISVLRTLPFKRLILTLYAYGNHKAEVFAFVKKNKKRVWAVTMWSDWWDQDYNKFLNKYKVKGFVHTVNDKDIAIQKFSEGVFGIYTDFLISTPITEVLD